VVHGNLFAISDLVQFMHFSVGTLSTIKDTVTFTWFSMVSLAFGGSESLLGDTQAAMWPGTEASKPQPALGYHPCDWTTLRADLAGQVMSWDVGNTLTANTWETLDQSHSARLLLSSQSTVAGTLFQTGVF
jgi:hypothetical protein